MLYFLNKRVIFVALAFLFIAVTLQGAKKTPFEEVRKAPLTTHKDLVDMQKELQEQQRKLASEKEKAATEISTIVERLKETKIVEETDVSKLDSIVENIIGGKKLSEEDTEFFKNALEKLVGGEAMLKKLTDETFPKFSIERESLEKGFKEQGD